MADKKEKEFKEYVVNVKSVGSQLSYKGKPVILNNGLSQSILKAYLTWVCVQSQKKSSKQWLI